MLSQNAVMFVMMLLGGLALAVVGAVYVGSRRRHADATQIVQAHGAKRCQVAIVVMRTWVERANPATIQQAWERIELPLLEALPDCPPHLKPDLVRVLEQLAQGTSHREVAKRIMTMRNGLIG